MEGYIKLFRKFSEWEWYDDIPTKVLFIHCLLKANFKDYKYHGKDYPKGSFISGRIELAKQTHLSERQVRTALTKLKTTNELTIISTSSFSVIQLNNWDKYQMETTSNKSSERPTKDQQSTTGEESNKEIKKEVITVKDDVYMQAGHLSITHDEFSKLEKEYGGEKADEVVQGILNYRKNTKYKSLYLTALTWLKRDKKKLEEPIKRVHVTTDYSKL